MKLADTKSLLVDTFREWRDDDAMQWSAALSYYAALAMAPVLVLLLGLAVVVFEEQTVREQLVSRIRTWVGADGADVARTILESDRASGMWAGVTSVLLLLVGATGVFGQLQTALDRMWGVEPEEGGMRRLLRSRLLAFALVLGVGALLVASAAVRTVLSRLPAPGLAIEAANLGVALATFTLLLAAVFKVLPDVVLEWRDVWVGALFTAVLFVVGQVAIGLYLGHSAVGSAYGAAGSLVALLVWIYYSAMVLFFGAEFTQVWARRSGRRIEPQEGARRVEQAPAGAKGDATPDEAAGRVAYR